MSPAPDVARQRADLPHEATGILDARTLARSHRRLAELLRPGLSVLDVGCGTGAITRGIAQAVGPHGQVVGVDVNPALIAQARRLHGDVPGLRFEVADVYTLPYEDTFAVVTAARVLQWLSDPRQALARLIAAAQPGGRVVILDYNHLRHRWEPEPPASFRHFYAAFLRWRADAGMANDIADQLPQLMAEAGLRQVQTTPQHEVARQGDPDFQSQAGLWAEVAASRGQQMVRDGYLTEAERQAAENDYRHWVQKEARLHQLYLLAVEGVRQGGQP